jgi:photosystem II stability/assembly factor-like uncharacterized protein
MIFFYFSLLILLSTSLTYSQNFFWNWQNTFPQGNNLNDIVVLPNGKIVGTGDGSTVITSADGGLNWTQNYPDSLNNFRHIYEASFISNDIGYACGTGGLLMKTTDGAATWSILPSPSTSDFWYIHFFDADTGYVCGSSASLYKTTNGGSSWNQIIVGGTTIFYKIYFINNQVGYIGTGSATPGRLLKTTNYGSTWTNVAGYTATGTVRGIYFLNSDTGFVSNSLYAIQRTTNGGTSFDEVDFGTGTFYEVKFIDNQNGVAAGANGELYYTSNMGTSWDSTNVNIGTGSNLYGLALDNNLGDGVGTLYTAGLAGVIAKSTDFGHTWSSLCTSVSHDELREIKFLDELNGYAVGGSTTYSDFLKTSDGGQTWNKLPFNGGYRIYSQNWINKDTGYVGLRGLTGIYKTTDAGLNFTQLNPNVGGTTNIWYSIEFANKDTGYACNSGGFLVKTTDGGTTWTALPDGHGTNPIYDIHLFDAQNFITVGSSGNIHKTTNGGANFSSISLTTTTTLYGSHFIAPDTGFVLGVQGRIFKTTNGGLIWYETNSGLSTTTEMYNITFSSSRTGWASGEDRIVIYTTDSGENWTRAKNFPSAGISYGLDVNGMYVWTAGELGNILRGYSDPTIPVELNSFTSQVDGNTVHLKWITSSEINNKGFEVEKNLAHNVWLSIGFVEGNGTASQNQFYSFADQDLSPGKYFYRLKQIDFSGAFKYSEIIEAEVVTPGKFSLSQNYPNPFNPATVIEFTIPRDGLTNLIVYNLLGERVSVLLNQNLKAGYYKIDFDAVELAAGLYFYRLESSGLSEVKKMMLLK